MGNIFMNHVIHKYNIAMLYLKSRLPKWSGKNNQTCYLKYLKFFILTYIGVLSMSLQNTVLMNYNSNLFDFQIKKRRYLLN